MLPDDDWDVARGASPRGGASAAARRASRALAEGRIAASTGRHGARPAGRRIVSRRASGPPGAARASTTRPGVVELARGLVELGVRDRVLGRARPRRCARRGHRRHARRGGHRVPRDAGRPREDAAPQDPRAGSWPTAGTPSTCDSSREHGIEPIDLVVVNLYPFRETVASGAGARGRDRADRHRRPRDGAGGGEEPRVGRRGRRSRAVRGRPRRSCATRRRAVGRDAAGARRRGVRAHGRLRRGGRRLVRASRRRRRCPAFVGLALREGDATSGTARTRTSAARLYAEAGGRRRPRGGARSCRGQGDVVQQLARRGRGVRARGDPARDRVRDRQAQQPLRRRGPAATRRGLPARLRVRHGVGVRRHRRLQRRRATPRRPRRCARCSPRSSSRPRSRTTALAAFGERASLRVVAGAAARRRRARGPPAPRRGARPGPGRDDRRSRRAERRLRAGAERGASGPTSLVAWTVASRVKLERDRARARTRQPWASAPGRCPASTRRGSPSARPASGPGAPRWRATPSSRSPTPSRSPPTPASRRSIHPGGSVRDEEVLALAESRGMAVVVTGRRHFRH